MSFEQGPIRPPSEAASLLVRVSRNCPWNRCAFCPVYKGRRFSRRSLEEVLHDVDEVADAVARIRELAWRAGEGSTPSERLFSGVLRSSHPGSAVQAAAWWLLRGEGTVFLQDADPLAMATDDLEQLLGHLRSRLSGVVRVTAYARTSTLASRGKAKLLRLKQAGLDRVHVGIESGSDRVLELVSKGASYGVHVKGGRAAVEAGLELSAYVMPGLGGAGLSREHAAESARCIAAIEPKFTRLRSLALVDRAPLGGFVGEGRFQPLDDDSVVEEIRLFVSGLGRARTTLASDHILNLIGDLEGDLPADQEKILRKIDDYLGMPRADRILYRVGRRAGLLGSPGDLAVAGSLARVRALAEDLECDGSNVDIVCGELMSQWV